MRALRLAIPLLFVARVAAAQEPADAPPPTDAPAPASPPAPTDGATGAAVAPAPAPAESPASASPSAPTDGAATAATAPVRPWRYTGTLGVISLPRVLSLEALVRHRRASETKWDDFAFGLGFDYLPPGLASFGDGTKLSWMTRPF